MLELQVGDLQRLDKGRWHFAPCVVEVGLHRQAPAVRKGAFPARREVGARGVDVAEAQRGAAHRDLARFRLFGLATVSVAVHADGVGAVLPVGPEAKLGLAPGVTDTLAVAVLAVCALQQLAVDAPAGFPAASALSEGGIPAIGGAAQYRQAALGRRGRARGDVDDAVDGVHAPQGAARAADDLDALDVFQHQVLHVPEHPGEQGRIDRAAIDHHQQLVGGAIVAAVQAARADRVAIAGALCHMQVGREPQRFGQAVRAGAADVLGRDHEHRCRRIEQALRLLRHRHDVDVGKLLDRQVGQLTLARRYVASCQRRPGQGRAQAGQGAPAEPQARWCKRMSHKSCSMAAKVSAGNL